MAEMDMARTISRTKEEYADAYDTMTWLTPENAQAASQARENLITRAKVRNGGLPKPSWSSTACHRGAACAAAETGPVCSSTASAMPGVFTVPPPRIKKGCP